MLHQSPILLAVRQSSTTAACRSNQTPQPQSYSPSTPKSSPPNAQSQLPNRAPKPPLSALNSAIVNNITSANGARPNREQPLPPNYKPVARKVTLAIVALPVLLVTSWVLWDRLVMGKERKELIRPFVADEEQPKDSDFLRGRK